MKNLQLLIAFLLLIPFTALSQFLPNSSFTLNYLDTCAFDSNAVHRYLEDWEVYQTVDSVRWGIRDSNCYDVADPNQSWSTAYVETDDLDLRYPLYFRSELDSTNKVSLDSNGLYLIQMEFTYTDSNQFLTDSACKEGLCNGLFLGIEVPDSAGTGTNTRWYSGEPRYYAGYGVVEFCIATERFPFGNHIANWVFKTTFDTTVTGEILRPTGTNIWDQGWFLSKARGDKVANSQLGGNWQYRFSNDYWSGQYMVMYTDTTYPDANHISYMEFEPAANPTVQQNIEIIVEPWEYIILQPFTDFRGKMVVGDTVRHNVSFTNNGAELCLTIVELVFGKGEAYVHKAGKVNLLNPQSCMMFNEGSRLVIPDGVKFEYGTSRKGMLALRSGCRVEIGKGSELVIHNKLVFGRSAGGDLPGNIYLTLNRGSKLTFGKGAQIENYFTPDQDAKIYINMRGGELDDSGLSDRDKRFLVRVYDRPADEFAYSVKIHGNPFDTQLSLSCLPEPGWNLRFRLIDLQGKTVYELDKAGEPGINFLDIPTAQVSSGAYFLQISTPEGVVVKKVVKN